MDTAYNWTDPTSAGIPCPHDEVSLKSSGLTPPGMSVAPGPVVEDVNVNEDIGLGHLPY